MGIKMPELISVIIPCYNEQEVLPLFYEEIIKVTNDMKSNRSDLDFEFLFINDGSKDGTLKILREYAEKDKRFRYISFSRNFGKEAAMFAGLENSKGDYAVITDADLQHPPEFIPAMYEYVSSGEYDCASTRRVTRKGEPRLLSFFSRMFYKIINKISQTNIVDGAQDFRFMNRKMVDAILSMREYNRFSKGIFSWVGFETKYIEYENVERAAGKTTWSFKKLFLYSLEGIFAFTTAPLAIASFLGAIISFTAFILIVYIVLKWLIVGDPVVGYASTVCFILFMGGIQLLSIGVLGQYISKMYLETKARPIYIVKETDSDL